MLKNGNDCSKYVCYVSQLGSVICNIGVSKAWEQLR